MLVGNMDINGIWITAPGGRLIASQIQYLIPTFTYTASINRTVTFNIVIKNSAGVLARDSKSTGSYTYSFREDIKNGINNMLDVGKWAFESGRRFYPGTWTIELWYEGVRLYTGKITLY